MEYDANEIYDDSDDSVATEGCDEDRNDDDFHDDICDADLLKSGSVSKKSTPTPIVSLDRETELLPNSENEVP